MKKAIGWILTLALLAFIFGNSAMSATASTAASDRFLWVGLGEHFVRKAAHFLEFAALGGLFTVDFGWGRSVRKFPFARIALFVLLTACTDETIQLFSAGRASMLTDVWLDFCGGLVGMLAASGLLTLLKKRFAFFD